MWCALLYSVATRSRPEEQGQGKYYWESCYFREIATLETQELIVEECVVRILHIYYIKYFVTPAILVQNQTKTV
jgi:hypothetical protein